MGSYSDHLNNKQRDRNIDRQSDIQIETDKPANGQNERRCGKLDGIKAERDIIALSNK